MGVARGKSDRGVGLQRSEDATTPLLTPCHLHPLPPPPPATLPYPLHLFCDFLHLNHDMNHDEPRRMTTNHNESRLLPGVVPVAGGSNALFYRIAWLPASKMSENHRSRTNQHITGKKKNFLGNIINILYQNNAF